jgi:hypothetical protein
VPTRRATRIKDARAGFVFEIAPTRGGVKLSVLDKLGRVMLKRTLSYRDLAKLVWGAEIVCGALLTERQEDR